MYHGQCAVGVDVIARCDNDTIEAILDLAVVRLRSVTTCVSDEGMQRNMRTYGVLEVGAPLIPVLLATCHGCTCCAGEFLDLSEVLEDGEGLLLAVLLLEFFVTTSGNLTLCDTCVASVIRSVKGHR